VIRLTGSVHTSHFPYAKTHYGRDVHLVGANARIRIHLMCLVEPIKVAGLKNREQGGVLG
jgi:hypothetical protein